MPRITAAGLRSLIPGGTGPAGRIQARLAVRPQPVPSGTTGLPPAKIMPPDRGPHENCRGVWTSHDPGTDSCARRYGTGAQPAGTLDPPLSRPPAGPLWLVRAEDTGPGDASALPASASTAAAVIAAPATPIARARPPPRVRRAPCSAPVITTALPEVCCWQQRPAGHLPTGFLVCRLT